MPDAFYDISHLNAEFWNDLSNAESDNWPAGPITTTGTRGLRKGQRMVADRIRGTSFARGRLQPIRRNSRFNMFSQGLEDGPHNACHLLVGGRQGHMRAGLSPLDPIFWLHHCNVDRFWAEWQQAGNNTPDPGQTYTDHFVDETGSGVGLVTARAAINRQALGYTYDTLQPDLVAMRARQLGVSPTGASSDAFLKSAKLTVPVEIGRALAQGAASQSGEIRVVPVQVPALLDVLSQTRIFHATEFLGEPRSALEPRRIVARLIGLRQPPDTSTAVSLWVNCPYLSSSTPITDEHCAGVISFFAPQQETGNQARTISPATGVPHGKESIHGAQASPRPHPAGRDLPHRQADPRPARLPEHWHTSDRGSRKAARQSDGRNTSGSGVRCQTLAFVRGSGGEVRAGEPAQAEPP
jgi:tyrosinase